MAIVHIIGHQIAKCLLAAGCVAEDGEPTDLRVTGELATAA